jgi:F0F1-type ATP synthase assembly protein I
MVARWSSIGPRPSDAGIRLNRSALLGGSFEVVDADRAKSIVQRIDFGIQALTGLLVGLCVPFIVAASIANNAPLNLILLVPLGLLIWLQVRGNKKRRRANQTRL